METTKHSIASGDSGKNILSREQARHLIRAATAVSKVLGMSHAKALQYLVFGKAGVKNIHGRYLK